MLVLVRDVYVSVHVMLVLVRDVYNLRPSRELRSFHRDATEDWWWDTNTHAWAQGVSLWPHFKGSRICNLHWNWWVLKNLLAAMADSVRELQVNTLEGGVLTVRVQATTTIGELKFLLRKKKQTNPIERRILKAEVLVGGAVVDCDYQPLAAVGLLDDGEFEVTVVYSRKEVEAATKETIYSKGFVQVNIPASLVEISARAFACCDQVVRVAIPESVTAIGEAAFKCCTYLVSITIPESVTTVGEGAFAECSSLESITIPDSVTALGAGAFKGCKSLGSITISESVTAIGEGTFARCSSLTSITIPDSVTALGPRAFKGCKSLGSITISDSVTSIGPCAFWECISLESVTIPESVTAIGEGTFKGCSSLRSITISDSVTSIGPCAFWECISLESVTIPESVTALGHRAFYQCSRLGRNTIPESMRSHWEVFFWRLQFFGKNHHQRPSLLRSLGEVLTVKLTDLDRLDFGAAYRRWRWLVWP